MLINQSIDTQDHHWGKYDSGMAVYLYHSLMKNGDFGDQEDDNGGGGWYCRYGRRVLFGDDRGFVWETRFATVEAAEEACNEISAEWLYLEEGDYLITDSCSGVDVRIEGETFFGTYPDRDAALDAIRENMERDRFWANVWYVSDHGNAHLIAIEGS